MKRTIGYKYNCEFCNDSYELKHSKQRYCPNCKHIGIIKSRKKWLENNKDKMKKIKNSWNLRNPEKIKLMKRREYDKHKEEYILRSKRHYIKNRQKMIKQSNEWARNNIERVKEIKRKNSKLEKSKLNRMIYKQNHKQELRQWHKIYTKKRRSIDKEFALKEKIRHRLFLAFKNYSKFGKERKSDEYGINYQAIIEHLKPFPENIFEYHIDHIIPISKFDFDDPAQIKLAFCPENHQWLKIEDNLKKFNKIPEVIPNNLKVALKEIEVFHNA